MKTIVIAKPLTVIDEEHPVLIMSGDIPRMERYLAVHSLTNSYNILLYDIKGSRPEIIMVLRGILGVDAIQYIADEIKIRL